MIKKTLCLFGAVFLLLVLLPTTVYALTAIDNADVFPQMNDQAADGFLLKSPVLASHVHTPSEWRTTQVYHYKVCTTCGDLLEEEDHKGGVSSCAEPMICSVCDYAYKQPHENHTPDTSKWVARGDMYHFHKCIYCGAHCDIEDHRGGVSSCAEPMICSVCDYAYKQPHENHTPDTSKWVARGDMYHFHKCIYCGAHCDIEDHRGGVSSCAEPMICSVCDYAYKQPHENHTPDTSKWVARGDMYHFHKCIYCGAHCDIEDHSMSSQFQSVGEDGHTHQCADCKWQDTVKPHNPGPEATESAPQTCTDCGYIITPAKTHVHNLSKVAQVPATCMTEGNIEYYTCTGCTDIFSDPEGKNIISDTASVKLGALGHTTSDDWKQDEKYHWRICTVCNEVLTETQMVHELKDGKCTTCTYRIPVDKTPAEPQTQSGPPWWTLLLIGFVSLGAGIGGSILVMKMLKKKE